MLTIATINPKQAEEYYQQENYYSKGAALENSEWFGRGAEKLGLSGEIADNQVYKNLVNGLSPDGKQALRCKPQGFSKEEAQTNSPSKQSKKQKKQSKERAGVDLTFSAPKSVSLACLVGGDGRLEEAHRRAVKRTLEFIEKHYPQTRIKKERVQTDNLTVALWHHDTSRELDPHLHTHCILMNFTCLPDGKWQSRTDENLYYNKMLLGQIYRQELALECRALGYEIEPQPKELFEIKGYTREQIEAFSKRHEQIVEYLEEREIDVTTENKVWAWRRTRVKKNHEMGRNEKLEHWHEEADLYGIVHPVPFQEIGRATATTSEVTQNQEVEAESVATQDEEIEAQLQAAIGVAIEHCKERKVAFKQEDILKFVTAELKPFSTSQLEQAIPQHPELIKTYDGRYTTQTALARELATIKLMQQGKGQVSPIAAQETIDSYLADKKLTLGQRSAITLSATSTDQFIAWQGVAGAGKTYALNAVQEVTTALSQVAPEYIIKGFAPSAEAAKVLGEELGIEANTVARLLVSKQSEQPPPNQIWIVDEAGLLSAKNAHSLLQRATEEGARVILVGDTRQLSAIEAGNPFKSLQSAGIATAYLDESLRQKPPDLQKAVGLAANGLLGEALSHLHQLERIEEVADAQERTAKMAADYIKLPPKERQQTLIVAGTHLERCAITEQIRTALKEEGTLGYGVKVTQLKAKQNLTAVQTRYTHNYNVGDVVVPVRDYKRLGLHKALAYKVEALEGDKIHLSDLAGNGRVVDPMKFRKTLYNQENIDIAVGDRLRWTRNDKELGRRNGQEFTVTSIDGHTATIELEGGKTSTIDLYGPLHLDHALVATTYSSQGKTADRVLISSTVDATVSQESVYVAISRAKHDLKIYAENIDYLLEQAQESKAQETVWEVLHPQAKVQVAAAEARAVTSSVEQSVGVPTTPKVSSSKEESVSSIERPLKRQNQQAAKSTTPSPTLKPQPPKQLEVFWQPNSDRSCPPHIEAKHWRELVEGSAIHPDIAALNFRSLQMGSIEQEHQAWDYLMYSPKLERTNTGQLTTGYLKRYAHIEAGGWWCNSGANALSFSNLETGNKPQEKIWGCYKPNEPRSNPDKPGKVIKYEHPPKTDLGIFLLDVPEYIAQKIYAKAGIDPSENERASGFWYCVWKYNLPIVVTEGAKKAASLLSQGHAAIGLPGIYAGYRSKDEQGNPIKAHLHEELAAFATLGRRVTFCFDYETRLETKLNIEIAISRTGSLLRQQGAKVSVVSLSGPEKGVDDLIVARSPLAFEQQLVAALPLQQWREANKQERQIAIAPPQKLTITQRKERLNQPLSGQPPNNTQSLNQSQEQSSYDNIDWRQINQKSTTDGQHNFADGDRQLDAEYGRSESSKRQLDAEYGRSESSKRQLDAEYGRSESSKHQLDSQHGGVESPEQRSPGGEQRTQELHPQAIERYSLDSQTNAGRLHHPVQVSLAGTEVGQTERDNPRVSHINEQSVAQARGHQHDSSPSQRAGDGNLRGNYQPTETTPQQRQELSASGQQGWTQAVGDLAQVVQSVGVQQLLGDAGLNHQLAELTEQINNLNLQRKPYEFSGLSELAQALTGQQSQGALVASLEQIEPALSKFTGQVVAIDKLPQTNSSALISALHPQIQDLAQTVATWQLGAEFTKELAQTNQVIQQLKQRQTFDFGELPNLLGQVNAEQLLTQSGLDVELASLTQRLTQFTPPAPTVFAGMDALAKNLLSHQAQSQLPMAELVEKANAIAQQITDLKPKSKAHEYKFEGSAALGELAQKQYFFTTEQQLLQGGLLEQLQQTTNKAISAISQHNEQLQEDLSMLQTVNKAKAFKKANIAYTQENVNTLAHQLRDLPLDEIAIRLGLSQDKYDKHKWRGEGQIISINDQKFYDHANLKGGYGAIDLVMHVQAREFKEALGWLADSALELPPVKMRSPLSEPPQASPQAQPKAKDRQPFQPPVPDDSQWLAVRQYLVEKRQLPAPLVDELYNFGKVYADAKQNAVFLRQDIEGNLTGASLRGTYNDSPFKGLSTGSHREGGCFSFVQGEGHLERIVITESAIDALSAAALTKQQRRTMFVSTDGAGSVPTSWLKQQQQQGVEIVAAHDSDCPGETMAWRLANELGAVTRATPTVGKDWNEHLLGIESQLDPSGWKLVALAIGKPDAYTGRIEAVVASGQPLPTEAAAAMRLDFNAYKQTASNLWQWYEAAKEVGKPDAYLERITQVAIAFHHPKAPTPLPEQAEIAMQQDVAQHQQLLSVKLWRHYSRDADPAHPIKTASIVAYGAARDGCSPDKINQILQHDPVLVKIRERSGDGAAQNHLKIALRFAEYQMRWSLREPPQASHQQLQQFNKQQSQQKPGLQL